MVTDRPGHYITGYRSDTKLKVEGIKSQRRCPRTACGIPSSGRKTKKKAITTRKEHKFQYDRIRYKMG